MYALDIIDRVIYKMCPFVAGGIFIGTVYWTMVTYGAVTVMQVSLFVDFGSIDSLNNIIKIRGSVRGPNNISRKVKRKCHP